ncbi:hypothetical protein BV898_09860 [Hypsibius exemplaris]|uniref:Uncharacterized protein n=1 Tax=Hypsibius exemplaris TaxID=2072580 RepID=A0A1W0WLA4_HYPEX|nr:hypothetical protein BV898_09860 [Hypsibius exemplaris]
MLRSIELEIPDVDPFFRSPDEIAMARKFHEEHGESFCRQIAKAVNVLAHARPHDPIAPFAFLFGIYFHQITDGITRLNLPPDDVQLRQIILAKTSAVVLDWYGGHQVENGQCKLKDFLFLDHSLTVGSLLQFFKLPWPPKVKPIQRIEHSVLEDGFAGLCFVSFAAFCLTACQLKVPVRRLVRVMAKVLLPDLEFSVGVPLPLLTVFSNTKKTAGKVKILQDIMMTPIDSYEPSKFFKQTCGVVRSFKEKMLLYQNWRMHGRTTMSWGMEQIQDAFTPLKKLTDEADFHPNLVVSLNTNELLAKGNYDVRGKPKPPEQIVKILGALVRRYPELIAILSPINSEHRDKLKPLCELWSGRSRYPLLFHEHFSVFHELLSALPVCFRGALITVKGEDTVTSVIRRIGHAKSLGLPVCLQNATGMAFSDSTVLLEMAVGLGVEYVKVDGVGHPGIWQAAELYQQLAEEIGGRQPTSLPVPDDLSECVLPCVWTTFPVGLVSPAVTKK